MNYQDVCIRGKGPGPTIAIFAGVHGNERAGVYALEELRKELHITRGQVHIIFANPEAIAANVRMVHKNLNRCFYAGNNEQSVEDQRARELMDILDTCDALLDLHMFYDDAGEPFIICEDNSIEVAQIFDANIISTNWTKVEPGGSDGYMYLQGKIGICLECGPLSKSKEYTFYAKQAVYQFLKYFNMTDREIAYSTVPKKIIKAEKVVYKSSEHFVLEPGLRNFELLQEGQIIARQGSQDFRSQAGECIIFPHYNARIGEEAYILGRQVAE